jgi:sporulation protein YlmC with PRC-barrel domain
VITHTEVRDLIGAELLDSSGDKVGRIGQIYLDESTGEPEWATVNTGLFGTNESFVPLAQADRAGHAVRVHYEKATIKDAPNMLASGAQLDESKERGLYVYYGLDYAGRRSDSGIASGQATSIQPGRGTKAKRGSAGHDTSGRNTDDAMTRSEEQVHAGTEKDSALAGPAIAEDEHEVTLTEEPVVAKESVPVERVRLTKEIGQSSPVDD